MQVDGEIFCYDDTPANMDETLLGRFKILKSPEEARQAFRKDPRFVIGVGKPAARELLSDKLESLGGKLTSVISPTASIGCFNNTLGEGLNIMTGAVITEEVTIGRGTLINANATIHHEATIGEFCEIGPGAHILGKVSIGKLTSIGSGAVLLPGIEVGKNVIIGAGAVVTKNVTAGVKVAGAPARPL